MLPLLLDENLNHRILRGLKLRFPSLDYVIAQATELQGSKDSVLLAWAGQHGRVLMTHDSKTIPRFAYERIAAGEPMPGVIVIPWDLQIGQAIEELIILFECSRPKDFRNSVV